MDKIKNILRPGHQQDDDIMYQSGSNSTSSKSKPHAGASNDPIAADPNGQGHGSSAQDRGVITQSPVVQSHSTAPTSGSTGTAATASGAPQIAPLPTTGSSHFTSSNQQLGSEPASSSVDRDTSGTAATGAAGIGAVTSSSSTSRDGNNSTEQAARGHKSTASNSSNHRSVWPANNDHRPGAAGVSDEAARKEALERDRAAANLAAAHPLQEKNRPDVASATYTYTSRKVGGATPGMDSNALQMPHIPGEFPSDDGDDIHGVQQEHPIGSSTTAPTSSTSAPIKEDHSAKNTALGAGAVGAGAAGLGAAAVQSHGTHTTQPSNVPGVGTSVTLPDRTVGTTADLPSERQTHPSGLGTTVGTGQSFLSPAATSTPPTNNVSNFSRPINTSSQSAEPDTSHTGRNAAIGAGAAGVGAAAIGAATYDGNRGPAPAAAASDPSGNISYMSNAPRSSTDEPPYTGTKVSNVQRSIITPENSPPRTQAAQPSTGIATNDAAAGDQSHSGRNAALAGGAGLAAGGLGYAGYEAGRSGTNDPALGTAPGQSATSNVTTHQPSTSTYTTTTGPTTTTTQTVTSQQTSGQPSATVQPANQTQQHHYGRDAALAGGAGAGAAGIGAAAYESNKEASGAQQPVSSTPGQAPTTADQQQHHYGRDAAIAGGAGVVGAGAAYAATDKNNKAPHQSDLANKLDPRVDSSATQQQSVAAAGVPQDTQKLDKHEKKELEKQQKEAEKHEKERQKEAAKLEKERAKEAEKHEKERQKEEKHRQKEFEKHEKERLKEEEKRQKSLEKEGGAVAPPPEQRQGSEEPGRSSYDSSSRNQTPGTPTRSSGDHHRRLHKKSDPRGPTTPEILRAKRERGASVGQHSERGGSLEPHDGSSSLGHSQDGSRLASGGLGADDGHHPAQGSEGQWLGQGETAQGGQHDADEWEEVEGEGGEKVRQRKKPGLLKRILHPGQKEETVTAGQS